MRKQNPKKKANLKISWSNGQSVALKGSNLNMNYYILQKDLIRGQHHEKIIQSLKEIKGFKISYKANGQTAIFASKCP